MSNKLNNWINKYLGKHVEVAGSPGAENQCVDWANLYIRDYLKLPIIEWTNAIDFPKKVSKSDYKYILNTPAGIPEPGDLVIWGGNQYGHIAVFMEGDANTFRSADQNYPTGKPVSIVTHNYKNVLGWLHPIKLMEQTDELKSCLTDREKFWKERDEYESLYEKEVDKNTQLKKDLEQYKSEVDRKVTDLENERNKYKTEAEQYKIELKELLRDLANEIGTTHQKAQILSEVERMIAIEDETRKSLDNYATDKLIWEKSRLEMEGEIAKLKQQLKSKDLGDQDFETLLKLLIQKIVKIIKE